MGGRVAASLFAGAVGAMVARSAFLSFSRKSEETNSPAVQPRPTSELEVLDPASVRRRAVEVFPTAYASMLSIVLGIAMGAAAASVAPLVPKVSGIDLAVLILGCIVTLTAVSTVYYNYVWFLIVFRWVPGALDTVVPLFLGASVIAVGVTVPFRESALWAVTAMYLIGFASYLHTLWRSQRSLFANPADHRTVSRLLWFLAIMTAAGSVLGVVTICFAPILGPGSNIVLGLATVVFAVIMIGVSERALAKIYKNNLMGSES